MKKFFTLIACALVAGSAFAQDEELVDFIGGYNESAAEAQKMFKKSSNEDTDLMAHFKANEWIEVNGELTKQSVTPARVVKDPNDEELSDRTANWCIQVSSRTAPVDAETGETQNINPWDSQFFITLPGTLLEANKKYVFTMRIKADAPAKGTTQTHTTPGSYKACPSLISYTPAGADAATTDLNFTTDWQTITVEGTVASSQDGASTIAINLAESKEANNYYFDDIQWSIPVPKVYDWVNIYENDGTDLSTLSVKYFKNYTDAAKSENGAIVVTSLEAEKSYKDLYTDNTEGSEVLLTNDWDTQFLITLPYELKTGDKIKVGFKYWASEAANTQTQCHTAAPEPGAIEGQNGYNGTYVFYSLLGDVAFTTAEQTFDKVITIPDNGGNAITMQSIAFNLNVVKKPIKYYFDDIVVAQDREVVPTAISEVKAQKIAKTIYNVAGQQIQSLQKGLNIVNGQKVYVK